MSLNYIVAPGVILKEYIDEREITQKELALQIGKSEKFVSNLINGKARINEELALLLENIFNDVKAEFWLNLETKYRLKLLRSPRQFIDIKEIAKRFHFSDVFKGLDMSINEQAEEMLKLLKIEDFGLVDEEISKANINFMEDGGLNESIFVWLRLCEEEIEIQNDIEKTKDFDLDVLKKNMELLKNLLYTRDFKYAVKNIRRFCQINGVYLVIENALPKSKIRGATTLYENHPTIFLSKRFKRLDTFYFAFVHELFHILNKDYEKTKYTLSLDETSKREDQINKMTRDFFVNPKQYEKFLVEARENKISDEKIFIFAKEHNVIEDMIAGFLGWDLKQHQKFNHLITKIKE